MQNYSFQNYWEKFPKQWLTLWCCRNPVEVYLFKATVQWDTFPTPPSNPFHWICLPLDQIWTFFHWIWTPSDNIWTSRNWIQLKSIVAQKYISVQFLFKATVQCVCRWIGFGNGRNQLLRQNTSQSRHGHILQLVQIIKNVGWQNVIVSSQVPNWLQWLTPGALVGEPDDKIVSGQDMIGRGKGTNRRPAATFGFHWLGFLLLAPCSISHTNQRSSQDPPSPLVWLSKSLTYVIF